MLNNPRLVGAGLGCRAWSSNERAGHPFPASSKEQDKRMLANE